MAVRGRKHTISKMAALCVLTFAFMGGGGKNVLGQTAQQNTQPFKLPSMVASKLTDHSLVGTFWDVKSDKKIQPQELVAKLKSAQTILIGEIHDNPDHHALQAWIIHQFVRETGRKPAIVMEMIRPKQGSALARFLAAPSGPQKNARKLGEVLEWDRQGWPAWKIYQPIGEAVLEQGLALKAGDADKPSIRQVGRKGFASLGKTETARLGLAKDLPTALAKDLAGQIVESHCNMIPASATAPMMRVQNYRDAILADNLLKARETFGSAILIAGNGHVRKDRAVPFYMRVRGEKDPLVIMVLEVSEDLKTYKDALPVNAGNGRQPTADFVIFTPQMEREDPCERFRKYMKHKKDRAKAKAGTTRPE